MLLTFKRVRYIVIFEEYDVRFVIELDKWVSRLSQCLCIDQQLLPRFGNGPALW